MLACFSCIGRILDSHVEDQTLSIPNLLRNAASIDDEVAVPNSSSGSGSTEMADADQGDVTSSSASSQIAGVLSEDVVGALHSQSTLPLPPADPRLLSRYNEILNRAMPMQAKKRRLDELINNAQEPEVTSASDSAEGERIRRDIQKKSRQRRNGSSSSQTSRASQPLRTNPIIRLGSSSNSQPMPPPLSRRPGPLSRRSPQHQPLLPIHRTPPSSLSSNEERLGNVSSNDSSSVGADGYQAPSLPDSPPLPIVVRPRDDSNGHTNAGAPRRISQSRSSSPQTRPNARPVTSKNFGG